ncbi:hypothetical protein D9M69_363430 [compost metagenome]
MTTTFFLGQHVHFALELGVRLDGARLGQNLATLYVFTLGAAQQDADVLTGTTFVEQLAEHLNAGAGGLGGRANADDLDFFLNLDDAALDTTGHHGAAAGDREHVFDRHQERLVDGTNRLGDVGVQGFDQLAHGGNAHLVVVLAVQGHQSGTNDDRGVITREVVGAQQVANFHLDQFQQLGVVNHVGLVQEHDDVGNAYLTGQQDVLAGLRHGAVGSRANQDRAVHLGSTGDHVLHVVGVTRAVYVSVVAYRRVVFNVRGVDGDTTSLLFRRVVDLVESASRTTPGLGADFGQGSGQSGFTVVNVTDSADVDVRFVTFKLFFSHLDRLPPGIEKATPPLK